jgi:type IX secretion system PorP/SprF family membrane protein
MKKIIVVIILFYPLFVGAQDVHFSQFWVNNIQYNPSLAGGLDGNLRSSVSYRNQWFNSVPYKTYSASVDTKIKASKTASLGIGLFFFRDVAGENRFVNSEGKLVISSLINVADNQKISIGVGGGFIQKNIERLDGSWNSQYINGSYDPNSPSFEPITMANDVKGDLSIGASYIYGISDRRRKRQEPLRMTFGFSLNHLLAPTFDNYTFVGDRLYRNLIAHGEAQIDIVNTNLTFVPGYFMQFQGPSKEIVIGTQYRYAFSKGSKITGYKKESYMNLGAHLRFKDAFITSIGFQIGNYSIGFSYDWNINTAKQINRMNGALEFNLMYKLSSPHLWRGFSRY